MIDIEKYIQKKITEALEGSFMDAQVYGTGYIKITITNNNDIDVSHIPFDKMDDEFVELEMRKKKIL